MPLPKSATKKENSDARLQRYHTRRQAEKIFGKKALKGKHVHHHTKNKYNNRRWNLKPKDPRPHGSRHGRGNKAGILGEIRYMFRKVKKNGGRKMSISWFGRKDGKQTGWKRGGRGRNRTSKCRHPLIKKNRSKKK